MYGGFGFGSVARNASLPYLIWMIRLLHGREPQEDTCHSRERHALRLSAMMDICPRGTRAMRRRKERQSVPVDKTFSFVWRNIYLPRHSTPVVGSILSQTRFFVVPLCVWLREIIWVLWLQTCFVMLGNSSVQSYILFVLEANPSTDLLRLHEQL